MISINAEDLQCPILLDLLEHPVTLPCCGKAISLQPFITYHNVYQNCPLCKVELHNLNPNTLAKNVNLAYMVEQVQNGGQPLVAPQPVVAQPQQTLYKSKMHCLINNNAISQSIIGKLEISSNKNLSFKTLLMVAVDESGSMGGNPTKQCQYSLHRFLDLTYKHKHLVSSIVAYDDTARVTSINTAHPRSQYETIINAIGKGGGTRFSSAFEKMLQILENNKNDVDISSVIILFMSDGCDGCNDRKTLTNTFKTDIEKIWKKDYTVHTIGFSSGHDYAFLDGLRKIGTSEGAYRFADPSENPDSLSGKINSVLDVIAQSCVIPIQIENSDIKVLSGENSKYWCKLTPFDLVEPRNITINVSGQQYVVPIEVDEDQNDMNVLNEWLTYSIDKIIEELTIISSDPDKTITLDKQIHLELLQQRSKAIFGRLNSDSSECGRLEQVLLSIESVKTGKPLNQMKLNDLKYEGKFKTDVDKLTCNTKSIMKDATWIPQIKHYATKSIQLIDKSRCIRLSGNKKKKNFLHVLGMYTTKNAKEWIRNNAGELNGDYDDNGSNPLVIASAIGRLGIVEEILDVTKYDITMINQQNSQKYTALDLAIIFGYDGTVEVLVKLGGYANSDPMILFLTCLKHHYFRTANVMVKYKMILPTEDLFQYITDPQCIDYLGKKMEKDVSLETAILKGLYDRVVEELPNITNFSWKPYVDIFQKSTIDHVKIVQLLVESGKADPLEVFETLVTYEDNTKFNETTWPLFLSCKRGQYMMFSALIPYYDTPAKLNSMTNTGNTMLWIASYGGHSDIVSELLTYGADPNVQNAKGDSALIPACQKGFFTVVEMLLNAGAKLDAYNKNRDNPMLICCRCGQAKILELLLNSVNKAEQDVYMITPANIDGFALMHASTELDKLECIKVCHKFGADLEFKTADDNKIIAGATALHLACFYGRINSVMVLVSLGADVKAITNVSGQTPLHIAIASGHEYVVRYLLTLEKGKECLQIADADDRLPAYYANKMGNDKILEEFFTNKLEKHLLNVLVSDPVMEAKCSAVLLMYGQSELCYQYSNITENTNIMTQALLNGNKDLVSSLIAMDKDMAVITKPDEFGISPMFWLNFMGYDTNQLTLPAGMTEQIQNQMTMVKTIAKTSPQNGLLCNLQPSSLKMLTSGATADITEKQNSGFDAKISDMIINNLKKSSTINYPLVGFVDKLKNNKVFPDGEMALKYLVMDAKYNIIRRIASGENVLQPPHMLAIFLYTSNYEIFKQVNIALGSLDQSNFWFGYINTLYRAIDLLPPFVGEVYRAVNVKFDVDTYAIGKTITWNTFSVCSYEFKNSSDLIKANSGKHGIIFIIQSKTGRKINKYSKYPVDAELIFLPNSKFAVKSWYQASPICLAQANIRDSTYRIREKDIERAVNGQASIIVELVEQ